MCEHDAEITKIRHVREDEIIFEVICKKCNLWKSFDIIVDLDKPVNKWVCSALTNK